MSQDDLKKIWEAEKNQLKKDLNSRKKVIKKREVDIKFGGKKPSQKNPSQQSTNGDQSDILLRQQLGL